MFDFLTQGGFMMWVLLAWSIIGLAFVFERCLALWVRFSIDWKGWMQQVRGFVAQGNYTSAIELCNSRSSHPLSRVLKAGLLRANKSDKDIQRAMEEESIRSTPEIEKNIDYIAMAANIATLLGLLGTIIGLVMAFKGVSGASAQARQEHLANGISVAMYTTAFGLCIAIPFLILHYWLNRKGVRMVERIEEASVELANVIAAQRPAAPRHRRAA
ncbi:MAG: MotA/TolQ/ExbB proton channel family protein [Deltaproteobacteria bacterium]|nr:MotA/TolQ/ExbB proton channel family protein [Deltaproteobacteria bacterium]